MKVSVIAAVSENGVIGRDNAIPWHLPADLKRFKRLTTGHPLIMGRKTLESIGRPLPDRTSIVLTRDDGYRPDGVLVARDLDEALALAAGADEVFVIGGEAVYATALARADRLYLTKVHAEIAGDAHFPPVDLSQWALVEEQRHEPDERHRYAFTFRMYERMETQRRNAETQKR